MTFLRRFSASVDGRVGAALIVLLAAVAVLAPVVYPGDPLSIVGSPMTRPFVELATPLGTDRLGRDLLAGLLHGTRTSMIVGLFAAVAAISIGSAVGVVAGLAGGWTDEVLMRVTEAFQTVPGFLLALAFISVVGPSLSMVVLAIALGAWTGPARLVRAEVLSIRERDFVAAARVVGMHPLEIAWREVLPHALPPVVSLASVIVAGAILTEAALSFLGLGDPNRVTWGGLIAEGRTVLRSAPYLSIVPGIALLTTVLSVHLAGEGIVAALSGRRQSA
jgi:peptide/nickel transport system permease protein